MPGIVAFLLKRYPHGDSTLNGDEDDKVWAAIEETGKPVAIHVSLRSASSFNMAAMALPGTVHFYDAPARMLEFIFSGVLDRFPSLNVFLAEIDCGWLPYYAQQCDDNYLRHSKSELRDGLFACQDFLPHHSPLATGHPLHRGIEDAARGPPDIGTGTVAFNERNDGVAGDDITAVPPVYAGTAHLSILLADVNGVSTVVHTALGPDRTLINCWSEVENAGRAGTGRRRSSLRLQAGYTVGKAGKIGLKADGNHGNSNAGTVGKAAIQGQSRHRGRLQRGRGTYGSAVSKIEVE